MPPAPQVGSFRTLTRAGPGLGLPQMAWQGRGLVFGPEAGPFNRVLQALVTPLLSGTLYSEAEGGGPRRESPPLSYGHIGSVRTWGFSPRFSLNSGYSQWPLLGWKLSIESISWRPSKPSWFLDALLVTVQLAASN